MPLGWNTATEFTSIPDSSSCKYDDKCRAPSIILLYHMHPSFKICEKRGIFLRKSRIRIFLEKRGYFEFREKEVIFDVVF